MFTFIIVVFIILYLFKINSRIEKLEHKLLNQNIPKVEAAPQQVVSQIIQPGIPQDEVVVLKPVPHQDNFAKNLAKFGIAILVLGVLFFLNYLDKQGLIGPVFKYVAGLSFGIILLGVGEYLRDKTKEYVNILRGAAFIIFYLTLFVGYILFKIVALPLTLGLIIAVLAVSIIISLRENDELPFTIGALGAYMVSFLINLNFYHLNQENTIGVLSYVLILNLAVLIVAFRKQWINSAVIGFIFTWAIFGSTLSSDIGKGLLFTFSSLFGLQYLIVFLLQDFKKDNIAHNTVFLTVINTIAYLVVFYKLVDKTFWFDYVGFLVALLGVFHFVVYMVLRSRTRSSEGVITLTHFVISILLVTVAVPLQFDGPLVTMIWFFEGIMLSFLAVLKDFKNKPIMYALGFGSVVAGISHMLMFGDYENVLATGRIVLNQSYIVWFGVFALINLVAYIWYNTVHDSTDVNFKGEIQKIAFALILIGQVLFVVLTSFEINNFGHYRETVIYKEINDQQALDSKLGVNTNPGDYNFNYQLEQDKYKEQYAEISSVAKQTTFMQIVLFILMTIIYFVIGLVKKNKIVRNMGIVTLVITSLLLIALTWELGPIYRIVTFVGFGILLLIVSYLYISKNKKVDMPHALMLLLMIGLFSITASAKVIDIKNWTTTASLAFPQLSVGSSTSTKDQYIYVLPINKDVINLSKKNDLSDIRIIDKDHNEMPYILVKSNQSSYSVQEDKISVKILENSVTRDGKKVLVMDTNREGALYNTLYLVRDPRSQNFRKKVRVYISDSFLTASSPSWREFEQKNVIYNYTDTNNFIVENLNINLSGVSSRFLKIELVDDTEFDKNIKVNNQISIPDAQIGYVQTEAKNNGYQVKDYLRGTFAFDNLSIYKDVKVLDKIQKDDKSEVVYEGDIDVEELTVRVDENEKNFSRNVVVQGSNDDVNWPTLGSGTIYRIDSPTYKGEKLNIAIPPSTYKKFKVIIQNNNNKPLDISKTGKVKLQNTGVLFKSEVPITDLNMVVGNNTEPAPIYDIQGVIGFFENTVPQIIQYNELAKNPDYVPAKNIIPFGERNKVLLNIGLLLFIVIVGIFGFFWMKKDITHHE